MNLFDGKRALVLGGGSARGLAHIGFIKVLEKHNIEYDMIVGTSMGALVGAMYLQRENISVVEQLAKDIISKQFARIVGFERKEKSSKLRIINEIFDSLSKLFKYAKLIKNEGYIEQKHIDILLNQVLLDISVSHLKLPFFTVAVDLIKGKPYIFRYENSKVAVKSSIAIPGAITPVSYGDMILVDGGVSSIVPVIEARALGAKRIVAVDVSRQADNKGKFENAVDVMFRVDSIRGELLNMHQLSGADIVIYLKHNEIESNRYSAVEKIIALGEEIAESHIDEIKNIFSTGMVRRFFSFEKKYAQNKKFSSVDFGSNTIVMSIFDSDKGNCIDEVIIHHDIMLNINNKAIDTEGLKKLKKYVISIKNTLNIRKIHSYRIMGTALFRELSNIGEIQKIFRSIIGKPIMILSSEDEARLSFLGNTFGRKYNDDLLAVLDVGGASSELIIGISPLRKYIESMAIGSKKLKMICEKEGINTEDKIRSKAREYIKYYKNMGKVRLIVSGGTITVIAGVFHDLKNYSRDKIDNSIVKTEQIDYYISEFLHKSIEEIADSLPYDKERADHIVYGLVIISEVMHMYGLKELTTATGGIRRGMYLFCNKSTYL